MVAANSCSTKMNSEEYEYFTTLFSKQKKKKKKYAIKHTWEDYLLSRCVSKGWMRNLFRCSFFFFFFFSFSVTKMSNIINKVSRHHCFIQWINWYCDCSQRLWFPNQRKVLL